MLQLWLQSSDSHQIKWQQRNIENSLYSLKQPDFAAQIWYSYFEVHPKKNQGYEIDWEVERNIPKGYAEIQGGKKPFKIVVYKANRKPCITKHTSEGEIGGCYWLTQLQLLWKP